MSKKAVTDSPRFQRAVKYINDNNTVKVPDAMRIVKYSEAQVADRSFQQRIRRAAANALGKKCSPNEITFYPCCEVWAFISTRVCLIPLQ